MKKKVYLMNISRKTNQVQMPIGLCVLVNTLKLHDIEVELIDPIPLPVEEREKFLTEKILDNSEEPAIYGFSITMGNEHLKETEYYAKKVLEANPENIVVYGGPLPSAVPELVLNNCVCNYIIKGEGEFAFPKLINLIYSGVLYPEQGKIGGLYYKKNGEIIGTPTKMLRTLDKYSNVDYSQLNMDFYIGYLKETNQSYELMASRGCPYNCSFCYKVCGQGVSIRKPDDVLDEIEEIMKKFNTDRFYFVDENFFTMKDFFLEFIKKKQERKLFFSFIIQTRIDTIDENLCKIAKENGLTCISFAIESASQETLNRINKGTNIDQIEKNIKILRNLEIKISTEFIIGFSWDTVQEYEKLIDFVKKNQLEGVFKISYLTPLPGTKLYNEVKNMGLIKNEFEYLNRLGDLYWERLINLTSLPDEVLDYYYNKISELGKRKVVYPFSSTYLKQIRKIH